VIIDFHTHVFSPRIINNRSRYIDTDPCFAILYSSKNARLVTADELVASMDESGIDMSVITNIGWSTHELCVETNDYILESIARYPKRLIGFGSVQPRALEPALQEIERCARGGMKGIGELRPDTQFLDLADENIMIPFMGMLQRHNMILLTHASEPVGHDYPGKGSVTPEILYPFINRYPEMPIVCAHWGGGLPFYALMPEVKKTLTNVYFDTAASPFLYRPQIYSQLVPLVGADHILFGSDYPLMPQTRVISEINALDLPPSTKTMILSENARRILGIVV
jgi:hypothetical protein